MRHASLFSGIGGFDLAAQWMGWENVFNCEIDPFCRRILNYYWPKAISYEDIKKTDFTKHRGTIDVLSGGIPCQPFSTAGKRKGILDDRHLWPYFFISVRQIASPFVVVENVRGLTNIGGGVVFEQMCTDLENEGYEVTPFIIPACSKEAPHRRDRVWIIAYSHSNDIRRQGFRQAGNKTTEAEAKKSQQWLRDELTRNALKGPSSNTNGQRLQRNAWQQSFNNRKGKETFRSTTQLYKIQNWSEWPTQHPVCSRNDGLSAELDGITFSKWRRESIKAYGNAVVPQIPYEIFKAIEHGNS